jgi:type IV pilus assembly protein PilB
MIGGMNILIVDNDSTASAVLCEALEGLGHRACAEANSQAAWTKLVSSDFRVVFCDVGSAGSGRLELCRRIRAKADGPYTYIILLTTKGQVDRRDEGLKAGADDFLLKPVEHAEMVAHLEAARRILMMQEELREQNSQLKKIHGKLDDRRRTQIGEILVDLNLITPQQLQLALEQQKVSKQRLGEVLVKQGWTDVEGITQARAVQMEVPYIGIAELPQDPFVVAQIPHETAARYQMLAFAAEGDQADLTGRLRVAMVNPYDIEAIDLVQRQTRRRVEPYLASETGVRAAIGLAYNEAQENRNDALMRDSIQQAGIEFDLADDPLEDINQVELVQLTDQAPVIKFVNTLFADAVYRRASDIHIEPRKTCFKIFYRVDGQLREIRTAPAQFLAPTTSRIKIMADMDIAERRLPLDGRIALRMDGRAIDFRVSTLPTQYGERVVMRILDRSAARRSLDELGFSERNQEVFEQLIRRPHGIILVTGPTGSGKTTTLYAALNRMKQAASVRGTNIITCEDPIEYELDGISQSNVNEKAGLTFARQLRAILRQDPDAILVGEIRDSETAEIAFRAALTGHLVLSTLHCNEAAGSAPRLQDMGVAPYLIASSLSGVIAQRLVLRLCPYCREPYEPNDADLRLFRQFAPGLETPDVLYRSPGCSQCDKTGVRGRIAVHELMVPNAKIQRLIKDSADSNVIREAAKEAAMVPLIGDGLLKVKQGLASLEDVVSRLSTEEED